MVCADLRRNLRRLPNPIYFTAPTTTTAFSYPCGTFIQYDPKTDPKKPEIDGFSAGKWSDGGDAYVGLGLVQTFAGRAQIPARISTTNSTSGPGAYTDTAYDGNTPSYLLKNLNLKWISITNNTIDSVNGKIIWSPLTLNFFFGRIQLSENHTIVSYYYRNFFFYRDTTAFIINLKTGFDILVCSDSTSPTVKSTLITKDSTTTAATTTSK
ncbi:hypothetical protein PVAND_014723 [Polypedilum vanderplanki]|uniref:Uncharacterized protein n=1 Tax=Polypedilum vanderplanki TaxID=319348 RepID=A0A9J6BA68_POLVA|nr:hypothetical protein PVAND_014723 [Polypedilum vanderplanki]